MATDPTTPGPAAATTTHHVRLLEPRDVKAAAALHLTSLPHGFFPRLGRRFLREYYRTFVASPHAVALAVGDQRLDGLLVGVLSGRQHYRWVLRNRGWRLAIAGGAALLVRPSLLGAFLRGRLPRYGRAIRSLFSCGQPAQGNAGEPSPGGSAILAHVAVDERSRGCGVGVALVDRLLAELGYAGIALVRATTLEGAAGAVAFYERTGWHRGTTTTDWDGHRIVVFHRSTQTGATHLGIA